MRLLVISHTPHYERSGQIVGWGPTVRELDQLAEIFDEIVHVAPLHGGAAPESSLPYKSSRVQLRPVPPAGGNGFRAKFSIAAHSITYLRTIWPELGLSDVAHVRCPANIGIMGLALLAAADRPATRWAKYAGNWRPAKKEPLSYRFQRWWLGSGLHRGIVTVNGRWSGDGNHIHPVLNPCLDEAEIEDALSAGATKELSLPVRLLCIGRVESSKGTGRAIEVMSQLQELGVPARLDIIGDGPQRDEFKRMTRSLSLEKTVRFHGWVRRTDLPSHYREAHIQLLPTTCSEGWPKVLSEGMAYGVVPIAGRVSSIPQYLHEIGAGKSIPAENRDEYVAAIRGYIANPRSWKAESLKGVQAAKQFSYSAYVKTIAQLLNLDSENGTVLRLAAQRNLEDIA